MEETNESLGNYLKRTRDEKNVSIEQVAYATRISLKMLRALEDDLHTALPAPTFVRGYLQAYAKYVRIDTQDLLLRYQHHLATAPDAKRSSIRSHYLYVRERYQEKRRLVLVIILFVTMLSVAGAYFFLKAQREKHKRLTRTAEQIQKSEEIKAAAPATVAATTAPSTATTAPSVTTGATTPAATEAAPLAKNKDKAADKPADATPAATAAPVKEEPQKPETPVTAPSPKVEPTSEAKPAAPVEKTAESTAAQALEANKDEPKNFNLLLRASEDVWFRYQTDENEVKDLTLRSGKQMMLRAGKVIKIFSGNLGALKGKLNGQELDPLTNNNKIKSLVLPATEAPNYKLPLFPQFQVKSKPATATPNAEPEAPKPATTAPNAQ